MGAGEVGAAQGQRATELGARAQQHPERTVLRGSDCSVGATERMQTWAATHSERVERALTTLDSALAVEVQASDIAVLSVALRVLRGLTA